MVDNQKNAKGIWESHFGLIINKIYEKNTNN